MSSPSLRPLIDTCQKCSTSPANHEPRSPANGSFQNPGVCPQAVPSFPSSTPTVLFLALAPFSAQAKYRKPRSSVFVCSQTLRKRLLRRLEATLCQNILNALRIFARISKFRRFHETKQIQNEVGRFFYNLAEFVFEYFCDSLRILATFAKFCLSLLFAT